MVFIALEEIETITGCLLSHYVYELVVFMINVAMHNNLTSLQMQSFCVLTCQQQRERERERRAPFPPSHLCKGAQIP